MGDQIYDKIGSDMDIFKKLASKIPGFKGYIERSNRRDADKLVRETVAKRYEEQWQRVSSLQRDFISRGEIGLIDDLEASAVKLRTFADRVRRAAYGYAGFFDAVKINEQELAQMYEYDLKMLDLGDEVARAIDHVEMSIGSDGLPAAIRNLTTLAQQSIDVFNRREEIVLGNAQ
jgi:hypothetical protein